MYRFHIFLHEILSGIDRGRPAFLVNTTGSTMWSHLRRWRSNETICRENVPCNELRRYEACTSCSTNLPICDAATATWQQENCIYVALLLPHDNKETAFPGIPHNCKYWVLKSAICNPLLFWLITFIRLEYLVTTSNLTHFIEQVGSFWSKECRLR